MTYLQLPINSAVASQSLMLLFQTPHPPGQPAKRFQSRSFLVTVVCKAGLPIAAATPNPSATNDFHLYDYAGITQNFWCNHRMQSATIFTLQPVTHPISKHSLPFFDGNCKCDSDYSGKSTITYRNYGRNGTNRANDGKSDWCWSIITLCAYDDCDHCYPFGRFNNAPIMILRCKEPY